MRDRMSATSSAPMRTTLGEYDHALIWTCALLLGAGVVMVYSASIAIAEQSRFAANHPAFFLGRQTWTVLR